ncbi:hypothetical protein CU098_010033 [Rhizopus stolonifer]|uniref:Lipocalin-like domain-containing protein n=1 Tax=Rhizopus stolonifer TaxID=4846 RepID=A0A367KWQ3_RHIST|nr:hypothetical protein CU098_010033 [Rhizopus stolonifer]
MKLFTTQLTTVLFALSSISAAVIVTRDDVTSQQNNTISQYPNSTDIGSLNGTWYLTGLTSNAWDAYQAISQTMNISADCSQVSLNSTSHSTLDLLGSTFLNKTDKGVNATLAGTFLLQPPADDLNVTAHDLAWSAYLSQVFVNQAQWDNLTTESQENSTQSVALPDTMQATIYSRSIDSDTSDSTDDDSDTLFLWGSHTQSLDKRAENDIFGIILSRSSSVSEETFNKTLTMLPAAVNNVTIVLLKDSCNQ